MNDWYCGSSCHWVCARCVFFSNFTSPHFYVPKMELILGWLRINVSQSKVKHVNYTIRTFFNLRISLQLFIRLLHYSCFIHPYMLDRTSVIFVQDVSSLTTFFQNSFGITTTEKQLSISGRNWGDVDLNGWSSSGSLSMLVTTN